VIRWRRGEAVKWERKIGIEKQIGNRSMLWRGEKSGSKAREDEEPGMMSRGRASDLALNEFRSGERRREY
jgi:hypothetical protein